MTLDPMCPNMHSKVVYDDTPCRCEEYTRVREDERGKERENRRNISQYAYAAALRDAERAALDYAEDRMVRGGAANWDATAVARVIAKRIRALETPSE